MKSYVTLIIFYFILITIRITQCFQFIAPTVVCSTCTINTLTSYTITLFRDTDPTLVTTPWQTQPVTSGSNISIVFPIQFILTGSQTCLDLTINYNSILSYSCVINSVAKNITITGAITSSITISNVQITLDNIKNPSPALMTGSFIGKIGNDISAADATVGSVTLTPGTFQNVIIAFDPTTVNTTSNMIITAVLGNPVPASSTINVIFPATTWNRQLTSTHVLPITSSMSCSAITNMSYALTCAGSTTSTISVTISNAFTTALAAGSTIKFSINNLFSPPTTQSIDTITLITYNNSYQIDNSIATISGLTAKSLNLSISTTTAFTINTNVVIQFDFVLVDTISRTNYIVVVFPSGSIVNYRNYACQLTFANNVTYSNITNQLTFYQTTNSSNRNIGTTINLRIQSYTTPSSVRTTPPFYVYIMNGNGYKMVGSSTINILPKIYTGSLSTANTTINIVTSYSILFNLADQISNTGYFIINIPTQLTLSGSIGIQLLGTSINASPSIQYINITAIRLRNLNISSTNIIIQNITIVISGIIQPSSVKNISNFIVQIFYSNNNDIVAQATTTNTIQTTPGTIVNATVVPSSYITAAISVIYTFNIQITNALNNGSKVTIHVPTGLVVNTGGICMQGSNIVTCLVTSTSITYTLNTPFIASATITLSYSNFTNPPSTKPTSTFTINTYNSANQAVDVLSTSSIVSTAMTIPSTLTSVSLIRGSKQNSLSTSYTLIFMQVQAMNISNAAVNIRLPSSVTFTSSIICSTGSTNLICTISTNNTITIQFSPIQQDNNSYTFTILNINNPSSYRPTQSIQITTLTSDLLYKYSTISTNLIVTNNIPSSFVTLTYTFTNQYLQDITNLIINVTNIQVIGYYIVQFAPTYSAHINGSSIINCNADTFIPICQLQYNNITSLYEMKISSTSPSIPITSSITISGLTNPSTIPSDYTILTSYTNDNYLISQSRNLIQFSTYCIFPCKQCQTTARNVCTACYSTALTNKIYLFQSQCLATCPSGYIVDNINYICQACTLPCYQCLNYVNYCISCVPNSTYKYLNRTNTTSTCLSSCPIYMYADLTQIPNICTNCISPCNQCTNITTCITCQSGYLLYGTSCLTTCPNLITVQINTTCVNCSTLCATCSVAIDNCTSCPGVQSLYNGVCYNTCPGNLIAIENVCVSCDVSCRTCSITITNCTSCVTTSTTPYYYNNMCLAQCPNFYYFNTFMNCLSCASLNIGCRNCSSPTVCLSCDSGYVLLNSRCLSSVPDGYLNISGIAVPCQGDCATCVGTLTNCTSCRTLNLLNNTCTSTCPPGTIALNRICQLCIAPCAQCINTTTTCTKCIANSSLYLSNHVCVNASSCPTFTYADDPTQACVACISPCSQCNSSIICTTCVNGYFYVNSTSTCQSNCTSTSVGINRVCQACISPCVQCTISTTKCLTCISLYYYNPNTFQCLSSCPTGQIANQTSMQCMNCASPCKTCVNTTDTCLSCINGTYLSNNLCVFICPAGQFGSNGLCKDCQNNCTTCTSTVSCLSCTAPLVLYNQKCLQSCPYSYAIVSTDSVCTSCTTVVPSCSNCSANGQCYSCYYPSIYYNSTCWSQCPTNYTYSNFTCVPQTVADVILSQTLSSYTFPIPFTILGCVIFIACSMSKLQNSNTYLIGLLYTMFGFIQSGCLAYLIYCYINLQIAAFVLNNLYILYSVAAGIYVLNVLALIIQTPFLYSDIKFTQWLKGNNKSFFIFTSLMSLAINYKFKMILFTRLFRFNSTNAYLQNVYRFRLFNVFSFFGILVQALGLYVSILSIIKFTFKNSIFQAFLDVIIIYLINVLLAILIVWKPDSFFHQQTEEGYAINKKVNANGDDYSKQAILDDQIIDQVRKHGPDSYNLMNSAHIPVIDETSQQLSQKLTQNQNNLHKTLSISRGKNLKVYFANTQGPGYEESSNPFRKQQTANNLQKIHVQNSSRQNNQQKVHNIFSDVSGADERFSHDQVDNQYNQNEASQIGGSQNLQIRQSPHSPKKHSTLVYAAPQKIKTNLATQNDDIHNKISTRAKQLQQLKKQLQQQQQIRKQKRRSKKKLKKSIQIDFFNQNQSRLKQNKNEQNNIQQKHNNQPQQQQQQASYQQLSIKDSSQKQQTEYDSNPKTIQQTKNNINNKEKILLNQQQKLANVQQDFEQKPKDTIGSWMQIRITQQNRKLPVFSGRTNGQLATISLPQSQTPIQDEFQQQKHQNNIQNNLHQQTRQNEIDQQLKQIQKQNQQKLKLKQQLENNKKNIEVQFSQERSLSDEQNQKEQEQENNNKKTKKSIQKISSGQQKSNNNILFVQSLNKQLDDSSRFTSQIKKQTIKPYQFQQQNHDYDQRAGTRLNLQNIQPQNQQDVSLQDSHHEDEKINERPFSAHRKNNIKKSQALLQILAKAQNQKIHSKNHKINQFQPRDSYQRKNFKYSGGPIHSQTVQQYEVDDEKNEEMARRSRMYMAGLNQFQKEGEDRLNRKKTMNYPLNSSKKKSIQESELSNSLQKSRNKSFNVGQVRKFTSKDLSADNLDQLGLQYQGFKQNYQELMNERSGAVENKPGTSGTSRSNFSQNPTQKFNSFRRRNIRGRDRNQQLQEESLQNYYRKQKMKSNQKHQKRDKSKPLQRQKSFQQTKRIKQLQRIYLSKK